MAIPMIRELYAYHRWANRRLVDVAAGLGLEPFERELGPQWSLPSLRRMFAHIYGADQIWLWRWQGVPTTTIPGADIRSLDELQARWDALEKEQQRFIDGLTPADLDRVVEYRNTQGDPFRLPLGPLLLHVANHATHHRSEIATMITTISGSPPDTGINTYEVMKSGQRG